VDVVLKFYAKPVEAGGGGGERGGEGLEVELGAEEGAGPAGMRAHISLRSSSHVDGLL
jgi:hypothetical protein